MARSRERVAEAFWHAQLLWQIRVIWGGKNLPPPPNVPKILREE